MSKIRRIRSGGQSGADRAALDTAKEKDIEICGWCPKGGWAEDYPDPPGVLALYPELRETPSSGTEQRTIWNVRDSDATLIIHPDSDVFSDGTVLTEKTARILKKPYYKINSEKSSSDVIEWLKTLDNELVLNVAGPRLSEWKEAYTKTAEVLGAVIDAVQ